jgi:hypothetical protein
MCCFAEPSLEPQNCEKSDATPSDVRHKNITPVAKDEDGDNCAAIDTVGSISFFVSLIFLWQVFLSKVEDGLFAIVLNDEFCI